MACRRLWLESEQRTWTKAFHPFLVVRLPAGPPLAPASITLTTAQLQPKNPCGHAAGVLAVSLVASPWPDDCLEEEKSWNHCSACIYAPRSSPLRTLPVPTSPLSPRLPRSDPTKNGGIKTVHIR
jgi:hypothetical protein